MNVYSRKVTVILDVSVWTTIRAALSFQDNCVRREKIFMRPINENALMGQKREKNDNI